MAASSAVGHASRVGQHYSQVKQVGLDKRDEARIIKMRNFNNFIKSLLINMYTNQGSNNLDEFHFKCHGSTFYMGISPRRMNRFK